MEMLRKSVNDFTAALASKASVPGGGSASALAGSLAAALGGMVGELTVGKEKYAAVEPILRELLDEAETLRGRLLDCVEKDAAALAPLAKAYAIPKGDPQRAETLEACLTAAAAPPMEVLELTGRTVELLRGFADMGSPIAVSDAAVGAVGGGSGSGVMVWITSTGSKYHCIPDCGNTKTSWQVTLDYAISQGYEACKRCW